MVCICSQLGYVDPISVTDSKAMHAFALNLCLQNDNHLHYVKFIPACLLFSQACVICHTSRLVDSCLLMQVLKETTSYQSWYIHNLQFIVNDSNKILFSFSTTLSGTDEAISLRIVIILVYSIDPTAEYNYIATPQAKINETSISFNGIEGLILPVEVKGICS